MLTIRGLNLVVGNYGWCKNYLQFLLYFYNLFLIISYIFFLFFIYNNMPFHFSCIAGHFCCFIAPFSDYIVIKFCYLNRMCLKINNYILLFS